VILEQAPPQPAAPAAGKAAPPAVLAPSLVPWLLSAKSEEALREQARRLLSALLADAAPSAGAPYPSTRR